MVQNGLGWLMRTLLERNTLQYVCLQRQWGKEGINQQNKCRKRKTNKNLCKVEKCMCAFRQPYHCILNIQNSFVNNLCKGIPALTPLHWVFAIPGHVVAGLFLCAGYHSLHIWLLRVALWSEYIYLPGFPYVQIHFAFSCVQKPNRDKRLQILSGGMLVPEKLMPLRWLLSYCALVVINLFSRRTEMKTW